MFFLELEIFKANFAQKPNTNFMFNISFWKLWHLWEIVEKYERAVKTTDDNKIRSMRFECWMPKAKNTNSHTVHKTTHRTLRTTATTPSAEHHMQQHANLHSWRWTYRCPKHVDLFMIINHNCCIKLVPLVTLIIFNNYYFSTSTRVRRTRLNMTLLV